MRAFLNVLLIFVLVILGIDMIWILFWGGIHIPLGFFRLRSTTIEFPLIAFLLTFLSLLINRKKSKEALLFMCSIIFVGLAGEGMLRLLDPPFAKPHLKSWYEPSDLLGWQLVKNFEGIGPLNVLIKTNSHALRDVERSWKKKEDTIRILGLGDSFTFGWGVPLEDSFLKVLETTLQSATGKEVDVINAGVPGWGLNHYYIYLKHRGARYSPDVIVLTYFVDDLPEDFREVLPVSRRHGSGLEFNGGMMHHSRLYNFVKNYADQIRYRNRTMRKEHFYNLASRRTKYLKRKNYLLSFEESKDLSRYQDLLDQYLVKIDALSRQINATFMVLLIPDVSQLYHAEAQYINELLGELTKKRKIPFLDMTTEFEKSPNPNTFYFIPRDAHTNQAGHRLIGRSLASLVCEALTTQIIDCTRDGSGMKKEKL